MRYACIGYGSLVWNPGSLPVAGEWKTNGPHLPIELTDQEGTRMCLALTPGADAVETLWILLDVHGLEEAISALAEREQMTREELDDPSVGAWSRSRKQGMCADRVEVWAEQNELDGVVWTALRPRFKGILGRVPSGDEVVDFLGDLRRRGVADRAEEYIRRAPVQTAYLRRVRGVMIAEAAYLRWKGRGSEHGRDADDWLEAERALFS
jgi:hypothetical protein